jgi:GR25 family glycosyltransferase involved in LPS biosynthesis
MFRNLTYGATMKSRELHTTPVLVVTDYIITPHSQGKFLHKFRPASTSTIYQFIANQESVLEEGQRYNIGYTVDNGVNWVDMAATAKADHVDKEKTFYVSRICGEEIRAVETTKSDERVQHNAKDGYYLGKKYAWRIYGMAIANDAFYAYLEDINHPFVNCFTEGSPSIAYKEAGLEDAMKALIQSAEWIGDNRFKSPLFSSKKWFRIKGISAITDKK